MVAADCSHLEISGRFLNPAGGISDVPVMKNNNFLIAQFMGQLSIVVDRPSVFERGKEKF